MKVVGIEKLSQFKRKHREINSRLDSWLAEAKEAVWCRPLDIKKRYISASILSNNCVVFDFGQYRMQVRVNYKNQIVLIDKIGTHDDYMKWKTK